MTCNKYNILDYITQQSGAKPRKLGNKILLNPCPFCGHRDHFFIYPESGSYSSFSGCCKGGSLVDWLVEFEKIPLKEAMVRVHGDKPEPKEAEAERRKMQVLAKLLTNKVESFFDTCVQKYQLFQFAETECRAGIDYTDSFYRWICQGTRFYDSLTERFISANFKERVDIMRNFKNSYFFKLRAGDSIER